MTVYTIGYAAFPEKKSFFEELVKRNVRLLIDVRSVPYSSFWAAYNRNVLEQDCKERGIYYRNYAEEFGARQTSSEFITDGKVDFIKFAHSAVFQKGIQKVKSALEMDVVPCLMCAEKDPMTCHRSILIGKNMKEQGLDVIHILYNGLVESQEHMEERLMEQFEDTSQQFSMFEQDKNNRDVLEKAYRNQADKICFKLGDG